MLEIKSKYTKITNQNHWLQMDKVIEYFLGGQINEQRSYKIKT